jgi:hypothetical protein
MKKQSRKKRSTKASNDAVPILKIKKGASLKDIYAAARRAFTAADL